MKLRETEHIRLSTLEKRVIVQNYDLNVVKY